MGQIKWYKRDPEAALEGMRKLTLEQRGAYNTVLDLIYLRDGNLPDDERFIAGWLDVDVRVWKRIKDALVGAGKLRIEDGLLRNSKADEVVATALARVTHSRNAGKVSAQRKAQKSTGDAGENNHLASTGVEAPVPTPVLSRESKIENIEEPSGSSPPTPVKHTRGKDWPAVPDWVPVEQWNAFIDMRKRKRANPTPRAVDLLIGTLDNLRSEGHPPGRVLDQSTVKNWTDLYPLKDDRNGSGNAARDHRDEYARTLDRELGLGGDELAARSAG